MPGYDVEPPAYRQSVPSPMRPAQRSGSLYDRSPVQPHRNPSLSLPISQLGDPSRHSSFSSHDDHRNTITTTTTNAPTEASVESGLSEEQHNTKKPRACEACRNLKVRCEYFDNDVDGPCKRCKKQGRSCNVTEPTRKRQRRSETRVSELEKKIEALSASLHAVQSGNTQRISDGDNDRKRSKFSSGGPDISSDQDRSRWHEPYTMLHSNISGGSFANPGQLDGRGSRASKVEVGSERRALGKMNAADTSPGDPPSLKMAVTDTPPPITSVFPKSGPLSQDVNSGYADIIDRNVITAETAEIMFNRYINDMSPHMPAVVFRPGTTASQVRATKPTLFLAIMLASSGICHTKVQRILRKELWQRYADSVVCRGEKSLELLQALQISGIWYAPPERFEELNFCQLAHMGCTMAMDLGLHKKSRSSRLLHADTALQRDQPWKVPLDPGTVETRRAWLTCYLLSTVVVMNLRRPTLIRWTKYMTECLSILESSSEALPSDKFLCQWVRIQHIAEEIGLEFAMDDSTASVSLSDPKVLYAMKGFERDLEQWRQQVPLELQKPALNMASHLIDLYLHEVAMHVDHNIDDFRPPFTEESLRGNDAVESGLLSAAHINASSICLCSIHSIFDTFLTFDHETIRILPVFTFHRIAYSVIFLIKMYFSAARPNSELGKFIEKEDMKVDTYLPHLLQTFREVTKNGNMHTAAIIFKVITMLSTWFFRQKDGVEPIPRRPGEDMRGAWKDALDEVEPKKNPEQHGVMISDQNSGDRSLRLLSEVVTNDARQPAPSPSSSTHLNIHKLDDNRGWVPFPRLAQEINQEKTSNHPSDGANPAIVGIDPAHEQAMDIGFADGDLNQFFNDDAFFGGMMENMGGLGNIFEGI
ncbi:MAG: hypothetical protein M1827_004876 [Pycnora praestabilis]|nr:MAG: hypothetical protein M1827_004876 [Pycnora praestabilis]